MNLAKVVNASTLIPLPEVGEIAEVKVLPTSAVHWHTPKSLLEIWPRLKPSEGTYLSKQPFQRGTVRLKSGKILNWISGSKTSLLLQWEEGERLYVLPEAIDSLSVTSPHSAEKLPRWGFGGESGFSPEFEPKHPALPVRGGLGEEGTVVFKSKRKKAVPRAGSGFSEEAYFQLILEKPDRREDYYKIKLFVTDVSGKGVNLSQSGGAGVDFLENGKEKSWTYLSRENVVSGVWSALQTLKLTPSLELRVWVAFPAKKGAGMSVFRLGVERWGAAPAICSGKSFALYSGIFPV